MHGTHTNVGRERVAAVFATVAVAGALAATVVATVALAGRRFFQMDEFVFVRAAWLIGRGEMPYRDFFEHHTPFFYALLSPAVERFAPDPATLVWARYACLPILALLLLAVYGVARSRASRLSAGCAVLLLLTTPGFVSRAIEIRPDLLSATAFMVAGALWARGVSPSVARALLVGSLLAIALLSTQKSIHYLWGLGLVALWAPIRGVSLPPGRSRRLLRLAFLGGFVVPSIAFVAYLSAGDAWGAFWRQNVELAVRWQAAGDELSLWPQIGRDLLSGGPWVVLVLAGAAVRLVAVRRSRASVREESTLAALALPALLSMATLPVLWPYNLLPVFAAWTPFAAVALEEIRVRSRAVVGLGLVGVLALAVPMRYVNWLRDELPARGNAPQLALVDSVLAATKPNEAVFDSNGGYLFRPAAYRYWYHSRAMRALLAEEMRAEIAPALVDSGAVAWIYDQRFLELPVEARAFVLRNYQRYRGPIHLWGRALVRHNDRTASLDDEIWAVRDGSYFLVGEGGRSISDWVIEVDGVPRSPGSPFPLRRGRHEVRLSGPGAARPYLLWLPRTGELWAPETGRWLGTLYPSLF